MTVLIISFELTIMYYVRENGSCNAVCSLSLNALKSGGINYPRGLFAHCTFSSERSSGVLYPRYPVSLYGYSAVRRKSLGVIYVYSERAVKFYVREFKRVFN